MAKLEELVGQCLLFGVHKDRASDEEIRLFRESGASSLIIYHRNYVSPQQIQSLIRDMEDRLGRQLLVTVDHEGGRVIMFRDGVTVFPDNLAVGRTGNADYARQQGDLEGRELRRLGIDVNLGPVMDILTPAYSPNIGIRSYGEDLGLVARMGTARISAMQAQGVSGCAKHFPGKGHATVDAHLSLPVISSDWREMDELHLKPFQEAVKAGVDMVMSSHPYYPNLDKDVPSATFSRRIIHETLRDRLKFEGVIASDDLEMGAIKEICPVEEAAVLAFQAGHDLLLVCHTLADQRKTFEAMLKATQDNKFPVEQLERSAGRVRGLIAKKTRDFGEGIPAALEPGPSIAEEICARSARILKDAPKTLPLSKAWLKHHTLTVVFPKLSELTGRFVMVEKRLLDEARFVREEFARHQIVPVVEIVPIDPDPARIEALKSGLKNTDLTVLFCYDAHMVPGCRKLLDAVIEAAPACVVVLLRDHYDEELIPAGVPCVTDF